MKDYDSAYGKMTPTATASLSPMMSKSGSLKQYRMRPSVRAPVGSKGPDLHGTHARYKHG